MNANTKIPQMEHFPKYGMIYRPDIYNFQKKHLKNEQDVKSQLSKHTTTR